MLLLVFLRIGGELTGQPLVALEVRPETRIQRRTCILEQMIMQNHFPQIGTSALPTPNQLCYFLLHSKPLYPMSKRIKTCIR